MKCSRKLRKINIEFIDLSRQRPTEAYKETFLLNKVTFKSCWISFLQLIWELVATLDAVTEIPVALYHLWRFKLTFYQIHKILVKPRNLLFFVKRLYKSTMQRLDHIFCCIYILKNKKICSNITMSCVFLYGRNKKKMS